MRSLKATLLLWAVSLIFGSTFVAAASGRRPAGKPAAPRPRPTVGRWLRTYLSGK